MSAIELVHAEFSRRLSPFGPVALAGGSARYTLLGRTPKDYDLFVLNDPQQQQVLDSIRDLPEIKPAAPWHNSEPYLAKTVDWHGLEVQVLTSPVGNVPALLDTFDWNVCLFAFDGEFHARESLDNIGVGKPLRLQKVTYPLSTLRRGFRFSERFTMQLLNDDVRSLCRIVADMKGKADTVPA